MSTTMVRTFRAALATALILAIVPASAAGPQDQAAAVALFQEARKLATADDFEHACPKFAEAQRLFPTAGTLLSLGDCYEKAGRLASAWGAFKQAEISARNSGDVERQTEGARRAGVLEPKLAKLTILVPPATRVPGFQVFRNGDLVGDGQWGSAVPVDAGWHDIKVMAPGRKAWATSVKIETDGAIAKLEIPMLEPASAEEPAAVAKFWNTRRTVAVVVGGVGLAGTVVGAVAGGLAVARASSAKPHCEPQGDATACDPTGLSLRSDGRNLAKVADVSLALGGAAIVAGVVLFVTGANATNAKPSALQIQAGPSLSAGGTGLSIQGVW